MKRVTSFTFLLLVLCSFLGSNYLAAQTTVTWQHAGSFGKDNTLIGDYVHGATNHNFGALGWMNIQPKDLRRAILQFDSLKFIPSNATISSAKLTLWFRHNELTVADSGAVLTIHRMTEDWTEGTLVGNNGDIGVSNWDSARAGIPWASPGGDFDTTTYAEATRLDTVGALGDSLTFDITDLVKLWAGVDSSKANYGLLMKFDASNLTTGTLGPYTSDHSTAGERPRLVITYTTGPPPAAPTNVQATDGTHADSVRVTWNAVTGADEYHVYRATSSGGTYSKIATVTGTAHGDIGAPIYTINAPTSISATDNLSGQIDVTWSGQSITDGATRWYKVSAASTSGGEGSQSTANSGFRDDTLPAASSEIDTSLSGPTGFTLFQSDKSSPFQHTGLAPGDSVWYRIRVKSTAGTYSSYSAVESGTTLLIGALSGAVIDSITGSPVQDVIVSVTPGSQKDTTDVNGDYFIGDITQGNYTVTLTKNFYLTKDTTLVAVTAGDTTALNDLAMVTADSAGVFIAIDLTDGTNTNNLQFGFHPEGSDGFESFFGESQLPPRGQEGAVLDSRFINGTALGEGSLIDIRNNVFDTTSYVIDIERQTGLNTITVNWDSIGNRNKEFTLIEIIGGTIPGISVNMVSHTSHVITDTSVTQLRIFVGPASFVTWNNNYTQGWNLVSLGGEYESNVLNIVFPPANTPAYRFNTLTQNYESVTSLSPGIGYFIDFSSSYTASRPAFVIDTLSLDLASGWNMVGTVSHALALSDIDDPSAAVVSVYKNNPGVGYVLVTDSLRQGKGYWVNAASAANIKLVTTGLSKSAGIYYLNTVSENDRIFDISIDTDYGSQKLAVYAGNASREINKSFALPPKAPYEHLAVRFNLDDVFGMNKVYITSGEKLEGSISIDVPDNNRELILKWDNSNLKKGEFFLHDGFDGSVFNAIDMAVQNELSLDGLNLGQVMFSYEGRASVVQDYELKPNYPNPFNPETNISYRIKETGLVKLAIYNILGQEVRTLVRSVQNSGSFNVKWDGRDNFGKQVAGGMYIYRLEAKGFTAARKLLLIK